MNRIVTTCLAIGLAIFLADRPAQADEPILLRLAHASPIGTGDLPYVVAKEMGWYREWGLKTEDTIMAGDANTTRALLTGAVDVALTGPLNVFSAIQGGAKIKAIGAEQPVVDYQVVASTNIGSLKDLAGKIFVSAGPSGLTQALPRMLLKKEGIDVEAIKFVAVGGGHGARLQAVVGGKGDATIVNTITALQGTKTGAVKVLTNAATHFPLLGMHYLAVNSADLTKPDKRRAFEIFMRGVVKGARFIVQNPAKAAELLHPSLPETNLAELTEVIRQLSAAKAWAVDGGLDPEVTRFTIELEYELGEIKDKLAVEEVLDGSVVAVVLKQEGPDRPTK